MKTRSALPARRLKGTLRPPGDKSISHRALILGALTVGATKVHGLLDAADVGRTRKAVSALGASVRTDRDGGVLIKGRGVGGLAEPAGVLDLGNSGTGARLLMGALAAQEGTVLFTGDASLCRRPMRRVIEPLEELGATFFARQGGRMPLALRGTAEPMPLDYTLPVASAQVKSAILLAALNAPGETRVTEPEPTRDHTERMLHAFGAGIATEDGTAGRRVALAGYPELVPAEIAVPADFSSAAFPLLAGLLAAESELRLEGVGVNPLRAGLLETLREMGADIAVENRRESGGEPVAELTVRAGPLKGVTVPAERAPRMIDEYPVLAAAAACADGETRFEGVGELRAKESDRLEAIADGLRACGVAVETGEDWLAIEGAGGPPPGTGDGAVVETRLDHRIAMAFLVLGLASRRGVRIDDARMIETSFPGFFEAMGALGARIE